MQRMTTGRAARSFSKAAMLVAVLAGLSACGSSGAVPSGSTASSTSRPSTTSTGTSSSGSGAASTVPSTTTTAPPVVSPAGLDLTKLGSLTNYSYTFTDNGVVITGSVHSPTDWRTNQPLVVLHIDGFTYGKFGSVWYKNTDAALSYEQSAYPGAVNQFFGFLRIAGATTTRGSSCTEAGVAGHIWTIKTGAAGSSVLSELASACVADRSGVLLSAAFGAKGSSIPNASKSLSDSFTVNSIGTVGTIAVPSPVHSS